MPIKFTFDPEGSDLERLFTSLCGHGAALDLTLGDNAPFHSTPDNFPYLIPGTTLVVRAVDFTEKTLTVDVLPERPEMVDLVWFMDTPGMRFEILQSDIAHIHVR
jgi:hypothetical protein